jgi:uncharacterized protein involved in outer membrane biogenesis
LGRQGRWLSAIVGLVAVPILGAGIEIVRLDPNDYKQAIIDAVQDATGRTLSLSGPLRVSRSLWPPSRLMTSPWPTCPAEPAQTWLEPSG